MKKSRKNTRRSPSKGCFGNPRIPWSGKTETYIDEDQQAANRRLDELVEIAATSGDKIDQEIYVEAFCEYIQRYRQVDDTVDNLPGYTPGVYIIDGRRVLVT